MNVVKALILGSALSAALIFLTSGSTFADPLGQITSYSVPAGEGVYGITQGSDGKLWITQNEDNKIWRFDPAATDPSQEFVSYDVGGATTFITPGPDSSIWYSFLGKTAIGKITKNGVVQEYDLPEITVDEKNRSYIPNDLTIGPDGRIWLLAGPVTNNSSDYSSKIFRINSNGTIYKAHNIQGDKPVNIAADYQNNVLWYTTRVFQGANPTDMVGMIDEQGFTHEWSVPSSMDSVYGIAVANGKAWFSGGGKFAGVDTNGNFSSIYPYSLRQIKLGLDGYLWATSGSKVVRIDASNPSNVYWSSHISHANNWGMTAASDGSMWFADYRNEAIRKIGTGLNGSSADSDNDGLNASQELSQGTSDLTIDTDNDGLSDFTESELNPNRDSTFCGLVCAYPDPLQKDVYVEVDWMQKPGDYSMKPVTNQLSPLYSAFVNQGINLHIDTGEYGGGNQVPYQQELQITAEAGVVDFSDYKNGGDGVVANFDGQNRYHIWRYMISGANFKSDPCVSGAAFAGDDDIFISYQRINNDINNPSCDVYNYSSFDVALSGTIIHELGHSLCLTNSNFSYPGQNSECRYDGIDAFWNSLYGSSMNYTHQFSMVDYSGGQNLPDDHDDWAAIDVADFVDSNVNETPPAPMFMQRNITDSRLIINKR